MGLRGPLVRVCVQGLWHLGCVTAACLASLGHRVVGLDEDGDRIEALRRVRVPVREPGLEELIRTGLEAGNLTFTADASTALAEAEILWVTLDTPIDEEGTGADE